MIDEDKRCAGCDVELDKRVNLPEGWKAGDPLPDKLTVHWDLMGPEIGRRFAFIGEEFHGDRHYLPEEAEEAAPTGQGDEGAPSEG